MDSTENVILENAVAIQVGQDLAVNNYLAIQDVKNMDNVVMEPAYAHRVGTVATARYVRLSSYNFICKTPPELVCV